MPSIVQLIQPTGQVHKMFTVTMLVEVVVVVVVTKQPVSMTGCLVTLCVTSLLMVISPYKLTH